MNNNLWLKRVFGLALFALILPFIGNAVTNNLLEVASVRVHSAFTYMSEAVDVSTYNILALSFDYDATTLDFGPPQDSFVFGWESGGVEHELGNFFGLAGATSSEIGTVVVTLPSNALVSDLKIYIRVTANSTQSSDKVEITNLKLIGTKPDPVDVCPNLEGLQENLPVNHHFEGINCVVDVVPPIDVCANLEGLQESVPEGYSLQGASECILIPPPPTDLCPNLDGLQESVPIGYHLELGSCVVDIVVPTDLCPNIDGSQETVPSGYVIVDSNCVPEVVVVDLCPNLDGVQTTVPEGYILNQGNCELVSSPDLCPNLDGTQSTIPDGMEKDIGGNCIPIPVDVCPNIEGRQTTVPPELVLDQNNLCVEKPKSGGGKSGNGKKGTRLSKYFKEHSVMQCPSGYAKWIERFRESHVWVADDVYKEVLLVGGPKPGQRNLDGAYFFKVSGPTEVGDKYFRRFHKISYICVKG